MCVYFIFSLLFSSTSRLFCVSFSGKGKLHLNISSSDCSRNFCFFAINQSFYVELRDLFFSFCWQLPSSTYPQFFPLLLHLACVGRENVVHRLHLVPPPALFCTVRAGAGFANASARRFAAFFFKFLLTKPIPYCFVWFEINLKKRKILAL